MRKWRFIKPAYANELTAIIKAILEGFDIPVKHLEHLRLGDYFRIHNDTLCDIANYLVLNDILWRKLPANLTIKHHKKNINENKEAVRTRIIEILNNCR